MLKLYNIHKKLEDIQCYVRLFDQTVTDVNAIMGHRVVAVDHQGQDTVGYRDFFPN